MDSLCIRSNEDDERGAHACYGLSLGVACAAWYGIMFGWLVPGVWLRMETTMSVL